MEGIRGEGMAAAESKGRLE
ncbi:cuticular protein hypothetical 12 precursor, partial [Danaus plexippus plexippus]